MIVSEMSTRFHLNTHRVRRQLLTRLGPCSRAWFFARSRSSAMTTRASWSSPSRIATMTTTMMMATTRYELDDDDNDDARLESARCRRCRGPKNGSRRDDEAHRDVTSSTTRGERQRATLNVTPQLDRHRAHGQKHRARRRRAHLPPFRCSCFFFLRCRRRVLSRKIGASTAAAATARSWPPLPLGHVDAGSDDRRR